MAAAMNTMSTNKGSCRMVSVANVPVLLRSIGVFFPRAARHAMKVPMGLISRQSTMRNSPILPRNQWLAR